MHSMKTEHLTPFDSSLGFSRLDYLLIVNWFTLQVNSYNDDWKWNVLIHRYNMILQYHFYLISITVLGWEDQTGNCNIWSYYCIKDTFLNIQTSYSNSCAIERILQLLCNIFIVFFLSYFSFPQLHWEIATNDIQFKKQPNVTEWERMKNVTFDAICHLCMRSRFRIIRPVEYPRTHKYYTHR